MNYTSKENARHQEVDELMQRYRPLLSEFGAFMMKVHRSCSPDALGYDKKTIAKNRDQYPEHWAAHVIDTWVRHASRDFAQTPTALKQLMAKGIRKPCDLHETIKLDAEDTITVIRESAGKLGSFKELYQEGVDICQKIVDFADKQIQASKGRAC